MQYSTAVYLIAFFGLVSARPTAISKREVPLELSHFKFLTGVRKVLNLDNPDKIVDPVFGLLGNGAAAAGAGAITNLDCLHQATADRAFTNAKTAGDIQGQADSLLYAALERNTGAVGQASVLCTDAAVNPEIGAISQHQDPASAGAAAGNKAITLELAKQLASVGADPQLALQAGTFAPGTIGDPTGAGNTCDDEGDEEGCIFTKKLLVEDATAAEIDAAVRGAAGGNGNAGGNDGGAGNEATPPPPPANGGAVDACPAVSTVTVDAPAATQAPANEGGAVDACPAVTTVTVDAPAATQAPANGGAADPPAPVVTGTPTAGGVNVQPFTGAKGGPPPPVESSAGDRPFSVNGNTFVNIGAALQRSCAIQNNACANAINSKQIQGSVSDCTAQEKECNAAA